MNGAIFYYINALLVNYHVVKAPTQVEASTTHKVRPVSELLLQGIQVPVSVDESLV